MTTTILPPAVGPASDLDWVELVTGFACNCRCVVCPSSYITGASALTQAEMLTALTQAKSRGATGAWLGGGEPTLHPALLPVIRRARALGFQRVRVQTNGMRLAYPAYAGSLADAGATEVSVLALGASAATHDAASRCPGSFDLMASGCGNARAHGLRLEVDTLVTRHSIPELGLIVERSAELGASAINLWLVSLHGLADLALEKWVPSFVELRAPLQQALATAEARGMQARSYHTPPCVLDESFRTHYYPANRWRLLVVAPRQAPFLAEASPMEGGSRVDACASCAARGDCLGLRADYLRLHGVAGISPPA
jgi:MoaA/NifB/PqqE/SkfB family radical SAM enzyme